MGRTVQATPSDKNWYVVNIGDNRQDKDPFRVLISPMSAAEGRLYEQRGLDLPGNAMKRTEGIMNMMIKNHVHEVIGYCVADAKTQQMITPRNGDELADALSRTYEEEASSVADDIVGAVRSVSRLSAGLLGKSNAPSVSGQTAIAQRGSGDAHGADGMSEKPQMSKSQNGAGPAIAMEIPTRVHIGDSTQA